MWLNSDSTPVRRASQVGLFILVSIIYFLFVHDACVATKSTTPQGEPAPTSSQQAPRNGGGGAEHTDAPPAEEREDSTFGTAVSSPAAFRREGSAQPFLEVLVVEAEDRRPMPGTEVRIERIADWWDRDPALVETLETDEDGLAWSDLPPALYRVRVSKDGYRGAGDIVRLAGRGAQRGFELGRAEKVTGTVVDQNGNPLARARMTFTQEDRYTGFTMSDPEGRFEISLSYGTHSLATLWRTDEGSEELLVVEDLKPVRIVLDLNEDLYHVRGRVVADSGEALGDVRITIDDETERGRRQRYQFSVLTESDGTFDVPLPAGRPFLARFLKAGFARAELACVGDREDVEIVLRRLDTFTLRVLSADGRDVTEGVRIQCWSLGEKPTSPLRRVDIEKRLYAATEYPFRIYAEAIAEGDGKSAVRIVDSYESEIELRLERGDGSIRGRVTDEGGEALKYLMLNLRWEGGGMSREVYTEDGTFAIEGLPPDDYVVGACSVYRGNDYKESRREVRVGDGTEFVEFALQKKRP